MRVLIVVTHLLGAGHLTRAAALARAFAADGHRATLVSGGRPVALRAMEGIAQVQLPPVQIQGTDFKTLLDAEGAPVDPALLEERKTALLAALDEARPDILITELFPFGRRVLADEFTALLSEARRRTPRPLILCSIRDILAAPSKRERVTEAHERISSFYDGVLVHGDRSLIPLDASWPVDATLAPFLHDTGYVDEGPDVVPSSRRKGIVVSGGSSAASLPLYRAALEAARDMPDMGWRVLVGRGVADGDFSALQRAAPAHVSIERARTDFRALLAEAELSISQAGYNTCVDLLRAGVRAILVPFEAGHETEQRLRAEELQRHGLASIVPEESLSGTALVEAIRRERSRQAAPGPAVALDGAQRSVAIATTLAAPRPALLKRLDWSPLERALGIARERDCAIGFWWRDDDAVADTPALDRLLTLARCHQAGLALASIPAQADESLAARLREEPLASALVHGWSHANHAPASEKKAEFGAHRAMDTMAAEARQALQQATEVLGRTLLPVFVPPWNRMAAELAATLPRLGYSGVSAFGDRKGPGPDGLLRINTHVDPIDWHGTRSLLHPAAIIDALAKAVLRRVNGEADRHEPVGFLTHHLIHDEAVWSFCERLLVYLSEQNIRFREPSALFCSKARITDGL